VELKIRWAAVPGPEVGFEEIAINLPQARLNEALGADAFVCPVPTVMRDPITLRHQSSPPDYPSANDGGIT